LPREAPSEFRRYRQISGALFLILVIGGALWLGVSVAWELWGPGKHRDPRGEINTARDGQMAIGRVPRSARCWSPPMGPAQSALL